MRYEYELAREKWRERWNYVIETPGRWKEDIGKGVAKQFPPLAKRFAKVRVWAGKGKKCPMRRMGLGIIRLGKTSRSHKARLRNGCQEANEGSKMGFRIWVLNLHSIWCCLR